jgi:acyl transferase domain-containing protein
MPENQPIAIVGLSALFPGSSGAEGFWRDIVSGRDLITDVPPRRWLIEDHYDPDPQAVDKTYCKRGGFLSPVDFDPMEFGVPPNAIPATDSCQLLALLVAKWALEDVTRGGGAEVDRERASVILGVTSGQELFLEASSRMRRPTWVKALREVGLPEDVVQKACDKIADSSVPWQENTFPGMLGNVVAGRIANRFDLHGTNCVTDAACASSLAAISMAIDELRLGRSDLVLAGGADTFNDISMYIAFSKTPALSATGDCRPFSDRADGTLLGEGFAIFALKRLADAERDGNHIYAVIRGVGSSSDGKAKSIYAPLPTGQVRAMQRAYQDAGFGPGTVGLVEAHGTGTAAGDQAELESLNTVFGPDAGEKRQWCALGSVKSQVGHTKAAAGAAGIFKAAMALHHKVLPPTIKVERPNPALHLEESPFYLNTRSRPWLAGDHPRRAAVSSFGFGGTNFHLVLEEYQGSGNSPELLWPSSAELVLLSAGSAAELRERAGALASRCESGKAVLASVGYSSQIAFHADQPARLAIVATSLEELASKLRKWISGSAAQSVFFAEGASNAGKVAFLFPGQGSQYPWMGADVAIAFPQARSVWNEARWLSERVFPAPAFSKEESAAQTKRLSQTEWAQPSIGAASAALLALLRDAEVRAQGVAGHSFGEITALYAAGCFDLGSMLSAARKRGERMSVSTKEPAGMLSVAAGADQLAALVSEWKLDVVLANHNAPNQTVLSGAQAAVDEAKRRLSDAGFACVALPVSTAFHSPLMKPAADQFAQDLKSITIDAPHVPVYSNLDGGTLPANAVRERLAAQIAEPVRFQSMIERMYADGFRTFIEVGPKDVLTSLVKKILGDRSHEAIALDRAGADGVLSLWEGLGRLSVAGVKVEYARLRSAHRIAPDVEKAAPKFAVPVDGGNVGRPYPPPGGAAALPKPNPPKPDVPVVREAAVADTAAAAQKPVAPVVEKVKGPVSETKKVSAPGRAEVPAVAASDDAVRAYQVFQESISAAQREWQANLTRGHEAFLQLMESAFLGVSGGVRETARVVERVAPAAPVEQQRAEQARVEQPRAMAAAAAANVVETVPVAAPVAVPVQAAAAPVATPAGVDVEGILARIIAEKTGYPVEMLEPHMALEADLGIDSIKRVEIFSALQDEVPGLPEMDPGRMGSLRTLREIAEMVGEFAPSGAASASAAPAVANTALAGVDLAALLREIIAEKTGYPVEMLEPGMALEADLGIDSIKRVEIFSALQERVPSLPEIDPAQMGTLRTLNDIVTALGSAVPVAAAEPAAVSSAAAGVDVHALLVGIIAEKTGYPVEMLDPGMALEADLGIDSIKRVEIFSAVQDRMPGLPELDPAQMGTVKTIAEVAALLSGATAVVTAEKSVEKSPEKNNVVLPQRFAVVARAAAACGHEMLRAREGVVVITPSGNGVDQELARLLSERGFRAVIGEDDPEAAAWVCLAGLKAVNKTEDALSLNREALRVAKIASRRLETNHGAFVTVQDTGGDFGHPDPVRAWSAGLAGLARTAALEWQKARVKAIDIETGGRDAVAVARAIADELIAGGPETDTGLRANGDRVTIDVVPAAAEVVPAPLAAGSVVIATGGARGVTAAALFRLAVANPGIKIALFGRTELVNEPDYIAACTDDASLRRALLTHSNEKLTPAKLQAEASRILAAREIRLNVAAMEAAGCEARYIAVDGRDRRAVTAAVEQLRRDWGPVSGIVHGAGVLADKRIADLSAEQFEAVFSTKIDGLQALLEACGPDPLRFIALFSSVAARFGNVGQAAYAMANEILNKVAIVESQRRGSACVVKSLNWGPWDGGMVTPALARHFEQMGVSLIQIDGGAQAFVDELSTREQVEVVLGAPLPRPPRELHVRISSRTHSHLADHRIQELAVLPVVEAVHLFWKLAASNGVRFAERDRMQVKVLKGVRLKNYDGAGDLLIARQSGDHFELLDEDGTRYYEARMLAPQTAGTQQTPAGLDTAPWTETALYPDLLFHGPSFQVIEQIEGVSEQGIAGKLSPRNGETWRHGVNGYDAGMLDGGLQFARLWGVYKLGHPTLPMRIGSVQVLRSPAPDEVIECHVMASAKTNAIVCDIAFRSPQHGLIAQMNEVEMYAVAGA